ncbi:ResB protein required for cytochrome c biosynthesis [Burkholderiales bacterium JOSHI_001]|nr:ResB protein required for cytochrome c biosynthesis [Burkholderiales bacterium JOSHI_001]
MKDTPPEAPAAPPPRGHRWRTGGAGSAAIAWLVPLRVLGSTRLTPWLFGLLALAVLFSHVNVRLPDTAVAAPLGLLALHLASAMALRPRLRRGGLGLFHVCLLGCLGLLAWGRLTHFDGRVELAEGTAFDVAAVMPTEQGPWHDRQALAALQFTQGRFEVNYAAGVKRARTHSELQLADGSSQSVGDDQALKLGGWRFYTTHNKGFAPLLTWQAPGQAAQSGHLHMPAYPLFDWQQLQAWTPPGGPAMKLWVHPDTPLPTDRAFTLAPGRMAATLVLEVASQRHSLRAGEAINGPWGQLRFERLDGWMGYRIHRDPAMLPLLVLALAGVLGLAWHVWPRLARNLAPQRSPATPAGLERLA